MRGERNEVGVGESLAYLHCRRSSRSRTLEVAGSPTLERNRQQKVALLDALAPFTLDQPLRPPQPPGGRADLSPKCEVHAQPERATRRPQSLTGAEMLLMRPLEEL